MCLLSVGAARGTTFTGSNNSHPHSKTSPQCSQKGWSLSFWEWECTEQSLFFFIFYYFKDFKTSQQPPKYHLGWECIFSFEDFCSLFTNPVHGNDVHTLVFPPVVLVLNPWLCFHLARRRLFGFLIRTKCQKPLVYQSQLGSHPGGLTRENVTLWIDAMLIFVFLYTFLDIKSSMSWWGK